MIRRRSLLVAAVAAVVFAVVPYLGYAWMSWVSAPFDPRFPKAVPASFRVVRGVASVLGWLPARVGELIGLWRSPFESFHQPGSPAVSPSYFSVGNPYLYFDCGFSMVIWAVALSLVLVALVIGRKVAQATVRRFHSSSHETV